MTITRRRGAAREARAPYQNSSILAYSRRFGNLAGGRVTAMAFLAVPLGVGLGLVEIGFGLSVQKFLVAYGLLSAEAGVENILFGSLDPILQLVLVAIAVTILRYFTQLVPGLTSQSFIARIRRLIAARLMASSEEASRLSATEVTHILSNLLPRSASFLNAMSGIFVAGFVFLMVLSGMLALSFDLTLVTVGAIIVLGLPIIVLRKSFQIYSRSLYRQEAKYTRRLIKNVKNLLFIKLSGVAARENELLAAYSRQYLADYVNYALRFFGNAVWPGFMAVAIIILIVAGNAEFEAVQAASLVPFIYLLSRLAASISQLATGTANLQHDYPYVGEMLEHGAMLVERPEIEQAVEAGDRIDPRDLSVVDLAVGRSEPLLEGLNFELRSGETLVISGDSGIGKTTLLMTLMGLVRPLGGNVYWNGVPLESLETNSFRHRVGYSGADPFLFDGTIRENLEYGGGNGAIDMEKALGVACCSFIDAFDDRLEHRLVEDGEGISAGQKQRLSLARAILRKPGVLLLDEATANIDEETEARILTNLRAALPEAMIIAVSHRRSMRKFATRFMDLRESE